MTTIEERGTRSSLAQHRTLSEALVLSLTAVHLSNRSARASLHLHEVLRAGLGVKHFTGERYLGAGQQ